jgi:hypothetical protein
MELEDSSQILRKFTTESTLSHLIPISGQFLINVFYSRRFAFLVYACYMTGSSHFIRLYHLNNEEKR